MEQVIVMNRLPEGSYIYDDGKYKCVKCSYWSNYPCLLLSHLRRKTPCFKEEKEEEKKIFIFKRGRFLVNFE